MPAVQDTLRLLGVTRCYKGFQHTAYAIYLAIQDEWFTDDVKRLDDKKVYEYLQGHWIVEMSEMNAVANAKSIEETKSFLSGRRTLTGFLTKEERKTDTVNVCFVVLQTTLLSCLLTGRAIGGLDR